MWVYKGLIQWSKTYNGHVLFDHEILQENPLIYYFRYVFM